MFEETLYRDSSLERLSTPEQLDQLVQVTDPRSWLMLTALLGLLAAFVGWGVFGSVSSRVDARGLLLGGDVYNVVPLTSGQVRAIRVEEGDTVAAGDRVARIGQPELRRRIADAEAQLAQRRAEYRELKSFGARDVQLRTNFIQQQRQNLQRLIDESRDRLEYLQDQLATEERLEEQGLITEQRVRKTRRTIEQTRNEVEQSRAKLKKISSQELSAEYDVQQQIDQARQRVEETQRLLGQLRDDYDRRTQVTSPRGGRVIEVLARPGELVRPGQPVLKVSVARAQADPLRAVLYVATEDGKKIEPGMQVQVAPATVQPEEHGYMVGDVTHVSAFPVTSRSMMQVLQNDRLVTQLSTGGAPFEVRVNLRRAEGASGAYRWTSGRGPEREVQSGTPATAWVQVDDRRPVSLVVPALTGLFVQEPSSGREAGAGGPDGPAER